jgi:3-deoxy-D-manno-octulosonic-acid transferase
MRIIYTILLFFALPLIFLRLIWKSRLQPAYRQRLTERMGFYRFKFDHCIWVHAVSMGEVIAATPLIKKLKLLYPNVPLLVTTMTPTGAAQVQKALGDIVTHAYVPYDFPMYVHRFLQLMRPRIAIIMETELWPNTIAACKTKNIPVCILNARLSEKSAQGYQRIAWLVKPMLQSITTIATHGEQDAERFIALGAKKENVIVTGSIKFDLELPADLQQKASQLRAIVGEDRFIWVAGSTHEGEEEIILAAHKKLCEAHPSSLLILVPRHPDRFDEVAKLCEKSFVTTRRSHHAEMQGEVYLGDTMGEMMLLYSVADATFVGGSLIMRGGHNLLEPAALQKPVLSGPSLYNFTEISAMLNAAQALIVINDADALAAQLLQLAQNQSYRQQLGDRAWQVVNANRGALARQLNVMKAIIPV